MVAWLIPMFVAIRHDIEDPAGFQERAETIPGNAPPQIQVHQFLPAQDSPKAFCVWEAEDLCELKTYLDGALEGVSTQTYHPLAGEGGFGLPARDADPS